MIVIYIDIDTLRPDHVGCYGYQPITPNIDALACDAHRWTHAFAANTPCMPARASVFTGRFGAKNGIETHGAPALWIQGDDKNMLPAVLSHQDVFTATVSSFGQHPSPWFFTGFGTIVDPALSNRVRHFQSVKGELVNKEAFSLLTRCAQEEDAFLHVHYWDPHEPLVAPPAFAEQINYTPDLSHIPDEALEKLVQTRTYHAGAHMGVKSRADLEALVRRYDAEIRYVDHQVGDLIRFLKEQGMYEEATIILSADHGEQYGEGDLILEHGSVHDSCIRIPLLVKLPHAEGGGTVHPELVYSMDLAPTIAEIFGRKPGSDWHGDSLLPMMRGKAHATRDYVVCDHGLYTCQRAIRTRDMKMVHTYHSGLWVFPTFALYDLTCDPHELNNLAEERPELLQHMMQIEQDWLQSVAPSGVDWLKEIADTCGPDGLHYALSLSP